MAEEKNTTNATPVFSAEPKTKGDQYVGPKPAPLMKFPGDRGSYRADTLTPAQRAVVLRTVPEAKGWWK